jgi:cell division protein FtsI/penicillin-binding protein 2
MKKISRTTILRAGLLALVVLIVVNLFIIQIVRHEHYRELARDEHMRQFTIEAKRGEIYAMDGDQRVPVVVNRQVWTVFLDPMTAGRTEVIKQELVGVLGEAAGVKVDEGMSDRSLRYYVVAQDVEREKAEQVKALNLRGVGLAEQTKRAYVEGTMAAQTLGFVNGEGDGQYGVEGGFDERLAGQDGYMKTVTDVNMIPLSLGDENIDVPAVDGQDLTLTIDRQVQLGVEKILAEQKEKQKADAVSAVVLDARDSRVVAMASLPSYDPAQYRAVEDGAVFQNPVVDDPYEPASVMKTFCFAAGIDIGRIAANTRWNNTPYVVVDGFKIGNVVQGYYGDLTMQEALNRSLNTGSVAALKRFDGSGEGITQRAKEILYDYYYNKFHLGQVLGVGVHESPGTVHTPDEANITYANMTFGQGLAVNMLGVASAFATVVNGGVYHPPYVVKEAQNQETEQAVQADTSKQMREMLVGVWTFLNRYGRYKMPAGTHAVIGAKSGTAQVPGANGQYKDGETIGSFIGFIGEDADHPQYVVMTRISAAGREMGGWEQAAPIFSDIMSYMIKYKGIGV